MKIKWPAVMENERREFEPMSEAQKFVFFMLLQYQSPYGWGNETPEASDCSGAICLALYVATGHLIRTTADDLYRRVFTEQVVTVGKVAPVSVSTSIQAAFWLDGDGRAVHVCGLLGDGVVLNSEEGGAKIKTLKAVDIWFERRICRLVLRALDRKALERLAGAGAVWGLDASFWKYFER
jgi:murein DD-endopeptidase